MRKLTIFTGMTVVVLFATVAWRFWLMPETVAMPAAELRGQNDGGISAEIIKLESVSSPSSDQLTQLGQLYLQQVRTTGDASYYTLAENAFDQADDGSVMTVDALIGKSMLAAGRHEFTLALDQAEQAYAMNPYKASALSVIVDANVEMGRYEEAIVAVDKMAALKPGLESFSRIAYVRELHGDVDGAIEAMTQAAETGLAGSEPWLWTVTQLGNLYFNSGDWVSAELAYQKALNLQPDYAYAINGMAKVTAANGDYAGAIALLEPVVQRLPLPEFALALGDYYMMTGNAEMAEAQYDVLRAVQMLNEAEGMNVELEMALFSAEHGDPATALQQAQSAYAARPSIYAADTLAWAHYQNGNFADAQPYITEALRIGTQDAMLYFHASQIALALGDNELASQHLAQANDINSAYVALRQTKPVNTAR